MRDRGKFPPNVMMYITGAIERFANMSSTDGQAIGVEKEILACLWFVTDTFLTNGTLG